MARLILVGMLAALLGGATNAVGQQIAPSDAILALRETADGAVALRDSAGEPMPPLGELPPELKAVTPPIPEALPPADLESILECTSVVRLTLTHYEARIEDSRQNRLDFLSPETVRFIYGGVTQALSHIENDVERGPHHGFATRGGLGRVGLNEVLGGVVSPLIEEFPVTLAVRLNWIEEYVVHEPVERTYHLALPVGLPLSESGAGEVVDLCGSERTLVSETVPDLRDVTGLLGRPMDGWVIRIESLHVSLADTAEEWSWPTDLLRGFSLRPLALSDRVREEIDGFLEIVPRPPSSGGATGGRDSRNYASGGSYGPSWDTVDEPATPSNVDRFGRGSELERPTVPELAPFIGAAAPAAAEGAASDNGSIVSLALLVAAFIGVGALLRLMVPKRIR